MEHETNALTQAAGRLPIVFVVGTGRCGSSLLQETLARHPDASFISNVDDRLGTSGRHNRRLYSAVPATWTRKGRARFAPSEGMRLLRREVSPMLARPVRDLTAGDVTPWIRRRLAKVFTERFEAQGGRVLIHKFTGWPRAGLLQEVFPRARFVHVVRDGRAVANSLLQMPWWYGYQGPESWRLGALAPDDRDCWERHGRSFVILAALYWRILLEAHETARQKLRSESDTWLTVRYEDLLDAPRSTLAQVTEWLELPDCSTFRRRIVRHAFRSDRADAFTRDLTPSQVDQIEHVAAQTLERFGYLPAGKTT